MIICNLAVLLAERELKISKVAAETGISRTTLTALYYNTGKGVQFETANLLCIYLDVNMEELFTVVPVDFVVESCSVYPFSDANGVIGNVQCTLEVSTKKQTECPYITGSIDRDGKVIFGEEQDLNSATENEFLSNALKILPRTGVSMLKNKIEASIEAEIKSDDILKTVFSDIVFYTISFPAQFKNSLKADHFNSYL